MLFVAANVSSTFWGNWAQAQLLPQLVLNEAIGKNTLIQDQCGDTPDAIEIAYHGEGEIDIDQYFIYDDDTAFLPLYERYHLPDGVTLNGDNENQRYLIVWAADQLVSNQCSPFHTNFAISASQGDTLYLSLIHI